MIMHITMIPLLCWSRGQSHRFQFITLIAMWSLIISLVKTNRYHIEFHSSPIWNEYHLWSSALSCCGWLALSFDLCLHESINLRIPLEISWLALFWVLLAFLDQPFWLLQLSISNVPRITTSMLAFQVPHLVYLLIGGKPLQ